MNGERHKRYGAGRGGTLSNSVMTAYATEAQMEREQLEFRRAIALQILEDRSYLFNRLRNREARRASKRVTT